MYRTLVLNRTWRPHEIISWEDAITRMFSGKVEVLAQYEEVIARIGKAKLRDFPELQSALKSVIGTDAEAIDIKVPAVLLLKRNVGNTKTGVKFSKINVALRDGFRCQYCGDKLPLSALNYDHVIPKSKGGKTVWENIVMSCYSCNGRKADRTPDESGMHPLTKPVRPHILPMHQPRIDLQSAPSEWEPFLGSATNVA